MQVTEQQAKDILITAVEGGIDYWALWGSYDPDKGEVTVAPDDDPSMTVHITVEKIQQAVPEMVASGQVAKWVLEGLPDDVDSVLADCIIQWVMFKEVVYG